jgi:HK97 family phage major capsid protein
MTRELTSSRNSLEVPINETAPWDVEGVNAYWEGESDVHTASKSKFKMHQFRLHKLTAYVPVSEELLDDAPALESFLQTEASDAILHKINSAILTGTGAGMPNGILNSGFKVVVNKESGQTSTELLFENIIKMYSHCLPKARAKAVWIYNPALEEKLRLMKFDNGAASPVPVFLPPGGLSESPYATIMGRPAIPMLGATKGLGSEGDIQFVDLSFYYSVMKSGAGAIQQFMSTHVLFDRDQVAFKFRIRMAGNCPFIAPVNPENGVYPMSGLITLQDR